MSKRGSYKVATKPKRKLGPKLPNGVYLQPYYAKLLYGFGRTTKDAGYLKAVELTKATTPMVDLGASPQASRVRAVQPPTRLKPLTDKAAARKTAQGGYATRRRTSISNGATTGKAKARSLGTVSENGSDGKLPVNAMKAATLRDVFEKTKGHCHFCGDPIVFENRGWADRPVGHWEVDHVIQRHKGGLNRAENSLPACTRCNRLRWHRTGEGLREVLFLGVVAANEIKQGTKVGKQLEALRKRRLAENALRRIGPAGLPTP